MLVDSTDGPIDGRTPAGEEVMSASEMPADQFWEIMERAARFDDDPAAHINALRVELRKLPSEEIK